MVLKARKPTKGPFSFTANSPTPRRLGHRSSNTVKIAAVSTIILLSYLFYGYRSWIADAVENTYATDAAAALFHAPLQTPDLSYGSTDYLPAPSERYVIEHAVELGYDSQEWTKGCGLWGNATPSEISPGLHALINELREYNERLHKFQPVSDLRKMLLDNDDKGGSHNANICQGLELHEKGLQGIFPSGEISLTANGGYVEPLLPTA
jgi:hypothetical protein